MPAGEIAKRFTLTDLLGYLLSGTALVAVSGAYWLLQTPVAAAPDWARRLSAAHDGLDVTGKVVLFVIAAYLLGVCAVEVGSVLYQGWKWAARRYDPRLAAPSPFRDGGWKLDAPVVAQLAAGLDKLIGRPAAEAPPLGERTQISLAYSYLLVNGKDGFVQLMSGRGAMFRGLTGAAALFAAVVVAHRTLLGVESGGVFWVAVAACLAAAAVGTLKVQMFDFWWDRHVVLGFLASQDAEEDAEGDASDAPAPGAVVVTVSVSGAGKPTVSC